MHRVIASDVMHQLYERAERIAKSDDPVLILGETGTGKEVLARFIHESSLRKNRSFLPINCAAIPDHLIESELFGYKKGAFTDAYRDKEGLLVMAKGGTVFLDEIGELPLSVQTKLLRALEAQEILPLGATTFQKVDFRLIAASNRDLFEEKDKGTFRSDLFYRLGVFILEIPPLRERLEEIPAFVNFFLQEMDMHKSVDPQVYERLMCHTWPGNVRELRNVVRHAALMASGDRITVDDLPPWLLGSCRAPHILHHGALKEKVECFEATLLERFIEESNGDIDQALKKLGISRSTFYRKIKRMHTDSNAST